MEAAGNQERDWSELPHDILGLITSLVCLREFCNVRLVCKSWSYTKLKPRCCSVPWLMLPKDRKKKTRGFYCHQHKRIHQHHVAGVVGQSFCSGSSYGWLIMSHKTRGDFLFNPVSDAQIKLPTHHEGYYLAKTVLSCEPTFGALAARRCVVAAICGTGGYYGMLSFCRPGDSEWTKITLGFGDVPNDDAVDDNNNDNNGHDAGDNGLVGEYLLIGGRIIFEAIGEVGEENQENHLGEEDGENDIRNRYVLRWTQLKEGGFLNICDIIFHKGNLYALTCCGNLHIYDSSDGISWRQVDVNPVTMKLTQCWRPLTYLVEWQGELLMVARVFTFTDRLETLVLAIFKLDCVRTAWVEVASLEDQTALFIGQNQGESLRVSDYPHFRGNCIYYADLEWPHWMQRQLLRQYESIELFDLDWGTVEPFLSGNHQSFLQSYQHAARQTPLWITPNPR